MEWRGQEICTGAACRWVFGGVGVVYAYGAAVMAFVEDRGDLMTFVTAVTGAFGILVGGGLLAWDRISKAWAENRKLRMELDAAEIKIKDEANRGTTTWKLEMVQAELEQGRRAAAAKDQEVAELRRTLDESRKWWHGHREEIQAQVLRLRAEKEDEAEEHRREIEALRLELGRARSKVVKVDVKSADAINAHTVAIAKIAEATHVRVEPAVHVEPEQDSDAEMPSWEGNAFPARLDGPVGGPP